MTTHHGQPVSVMSVTSEFEADMVCDLLRTGGIDCAVATTDSASAFAGALAGQIEILVHEADLDTARTILSDANLP